MKKRTDTAKTMAAVCLLCASFTVNASARVNLLEPWLPGQDMSIGAAFTYLPEVSLIAGEKRFEMPARVTFPVDERIELGARWGLKYYDGHAGISDLLAGMKYQFIDGKGGPEEPSVIGEAALSLPTADSSHGLGTGAAGLLLHWAVEKEISPVMATFGIGLRINGKDSSGLRAGNIFSYHLGAAYRYAEDIRLFGELKGFNHSTSKLHGSNVSGSDFQEFYLAPGAEYRVDRTHTISGALLVGLTSESDALGLLVSMNF